jgi:hypothetical protein
MSRKGRLGRRPFFIYPYPSPPLLQVGSALRADLVAFAWVGSGPRHDIAVADSFQVTGDGHSGRPFGDRPFSLQPPELGCRLLVPSSPPALLSSRHAPSQSSGLPMLPPLSAASPYTQYSILNTRAFTFAPLHRSSAPLCTFARYLCHSRAHKPSGPRRR